jgi:Fic family protein
MPPRDSLESLALELVRVSGAVPALPEATLRAFRDLVRAAEVHFSLSIDRHRVHPLHVEQALRSELHDDSTIRGLQREALAYHKAERFLAGALEHTAPELVTPAFLEGLHWALYSRVPEEFRWLSDATGRKFRIIPGELRAHTVAPPRALADPQAIPSLLERFQALYEPSRLSPVERIIAAAASHHRLLWIHPFTGGNGRVARLTAAAYLQLAGVEGALDGLWSFSRGFGRGRDRYRELLAACDVRQRHDLDGRDLLSPRALADFTRFFLETCRDEIVFTQRSLRPEALTDRIARYVGLRGAGMAPGGPLHEEAASLLRDVALRGEVPRGEAGRITGMATSEARKILSALVKERLLVSDTPKGPVRLCVPAHAAPFLVPDLYPADLMLRDEPRSVIEAA